jgi:hypothetical protein
MERSSGKAASANHEVFQGRSEGRSVRHGTRWGNWTLDACRLVLVYNPHGPAQYTRPYDPDLVGCYSGYEVDLERCTTSAAVLDWIFQIETHGYDVENFVSAIADLLNPQQTLCSGCLFGAQSDRRLNVVAHLKKQFGLRQSKPRKKKQ